jgi:hypothetical protein
MLYQRETGVFCSCQVTWMAAGGMAHLTFILTEGRVSLEYYYCQTSKTSTAYPSKIRPCFYNGASES